MTRTSAAVACAVALTACGGGDGTTVAGPIEAHGGIHPAQFDVYAIGSTLDDPRNADVYGITLNPLRAYRVTTQKRISYVSANADMVVVAAADQGVDMLGRLDPDGQILDIPGLGRPHAFSPAIQPDGTIRYDDAEGEGAKNARYLSWNPGTKKSRVLFREASSVLSSVVAGPGGAFAYTESIRDAINKLVVVRESGKARSFATADTTGFNYWGKTLIAVMVLPPNDGFAPAIATILIDPASDRTTEVPGWSPIAWSPDGTRLLVQRTGGGAGAPSELALLDPDNPTAPRSLGTIPHLTVYQGSWIRGDGPPAP